MRILATVMESERIDPGYWVIAWSLFLAGVVLGTVAIGFRIGLRSRRRIELVLSWSTLLLALYPLAFWAHVHHIDFVEVGGDGTPASAPFWKVLAIPALPVFVGGALTAHYYWSTRSSSVGKRRQRARSKI